MSLDSAFCNRLFALSEIYALSEIKGLKSEFSYLIFWVCFGEASMVKLDEMLKAELLWEPLYWRLFLLIKGLEALFGCTALSELRSSIFGVSMSSGSLNIFIGLLNILTCEILLSVLLLKSDLISLYLVFAPAARDPIPAYIKKDPLFYCLEIMDLFTMFIYFWMA